MRVHAIRTGSVQVRARQVEATYSGLRAVYLPSHDPESPARLAAARQASR